MSDLMVHLSFQYCFQVIMQELICEYKRSLSVSQQKGGNSQLIPCVSCVALTSCLHCSYHHPLNDSTVSYLHPGCSRATTSSFGTGSHPFSTHPDKASPFLPDHNTGFGNQRSSRKAKSSITKKPTRYSPPSRLHYLFWAVRRKRSYVIIVALDALAPNKHKAISIHQGESTIAAASRISCYNH